MSRVDQDGPRLVLASGSPRRLDLLRGFGLTPEVAPADIDEQPLKGEKPAELVERLAISKAETALDRLDDPASSLVVAADTVIDLDGEVLGKPADDADAAEMLRRLSGRCHEVITGLAVVGRRHGEDHRVMRTDRAEVWFRDLSEADIAWYIGSGEPRGKAGAYAVQGLGSLLVARIEGSYQAIVGLSLTGLDEALTDFGLRLRELRP